MKFKSTTQLIQLLKTNGYKQISELLNTNNEHLFVGPNNLINQDKITSVNIFSKPIFQSNELNEIKANYENNINGLKILNNNNNNNNNNNMPISNHLIGVFQLGRHLTSHIHIIHGGAIATLIDEYFVKVVLPLTKNNFAVTANLNVKYLKPIKFLVNSDKIDVILECFISNSKENRKFNVEGSLMDLNGDKYCIGNVLVIVPKEPVEE